MFYLLYLTKRVKEKHFFVIFSLRVFSETYHPTPWLTAEVRFHHLGSTLQKAWALSYDCINELCWDEQLDNGGMQSKHARWMQLMFHLIAAGVGLKSCIFLLFLKKNFKWGRSRISFCCLTIISCHIQSNLHICNFRCISNMKFHKQGTQVFSFPQRDYSVCRAAESCHCSCPGMCFFSSESVQDSRAVSANLDDSSLLSLNIY